MSINRTVKTISICLKPELLENFDEKISPVLRSTAISILLENFIHNNKSISNYQGDLKPPKGHGKTEKSHSMRIKRGIP